MKGLRFLLSVGLLLSLIGIGQAQQWVSFGKTAGTVLEPKTVNSSKSALVLQFDLPGMTVEKKSEKNIDYQQLIISGAGQNGNEIGFPNLPVYSQAIAIPAMSGVSYKIISATYQTLTGYNVFPVQDPMPDMKNAPAPVFRKNIEAYSKNEFYPAETISFSEPALIRDLRFVNLLYRPVQFNPATGELKVCTSLQLQIDFSGVDFRNVPQTSGTMSKDFSDMLDGYVINKDQFVNSSKTFQTAGKYYIITVDSFYNSVLPLAQWRQRMGYTTVVDSFSKLNTAANDTVDIKNAIQNAYNNWGVEYVLLVGDHANASNVYMLPAKKTNIGSYSYNPIPHDHGYSLTSGTDYFSDVYVGRLPGQTKAQIDTMVAKIVRYERTPYMTNTNWFHRGVMLGSYETGRIFIPTGRTVRTHLMAHGFDKVDTLFESSTDMALLTYSNIDSSLEAGRAFLMFRGHGAELDPATGPGYTAYFGGSNHGYLDAYRDTNFASLHNGQMNGVVIAPTCLAADYAEELGTAPHRVMAEYFFNYLSSTTPRSEGSAGYFGAMDVSYSFYNDSLSIGIFDHILDSNHTKFQQACNGGKLFMEKYYPVGDAVTQYEFYFMTIAGDPAMDLWTATPDSFAVTYTTPLNVGSQTYAVNVKRKVANTNLQDAHVCVMMDDLTVYSVGTTDASGNVSFSINPVNAGNMYLTVTKHNYKPFEAVVTVINGAPSKPNVTKLLDGAKLPDLRPYLTFVSTDPQSNPIDYRVIWDTLSTFASPAKDSSTTTTYASGTPVTFQFPSNLTAGRTYWWKVKGRDPAGTNMFGPESDVRSFTVASDIPAGTLCWMHTKGGQFTADSYTGATAAQGDSVILAAPSSGSATLMTEDFEGGALPAGWDTSGSYPANYGWLIRTAGGTQPPSFGTTYEGCQFPSTSVTPAASEEIITTPQYLMNAGAQTCSLSYAYGMDPGVAADSLLLEASFFSGGSWSAWTQVDGLNNGTTTISGTRSIGMNAQMPKDGIQLRWRFSQGGGRNGQDAAIDNITLKYTYLVPNTDGTMISGPVYYKDITKSETVSRSTYKWGKVMWHKKAAADSIGIQVQYCNNNIWALVPDAVLPNNSKGFFNQSSATDSATLVTMDTVTYDSLRVVANLYRPASKASTNPVLYDIEFARPGYMAALGVSLSSFTAFAQNNKATVQWRTESEQDCYQWAVERSASPDGQFTELDRLDGNGTTSQPHEYTYNDASVLSPGVYYYRIIEIGKNGGQTVYGPVSAKIGQGLPLEYALQAAYPNPSQGAATIKYSLKQPGQTLLRVYNVLGEEIRTLVNGLQKSDYYQVNWDGRDNKGRLVSNGVYFYKLVSGSYSATRKLTVLR